VKFKVGDKIYDEDFDFANVLHWWSPYGEVMEVRASGYIIVYKDKYRTFVGFDETKNIRLLTPLEELL